MLQNKPSSGLGFWGESGVVIARRTVEWTNLLYTNSDFKILLLIFEEVSVNQQMTFLVDIRALGNLLLAMCQLEI